jgi:hypothetical protein
MSNYRWKTKDEIIMISIKGLLKHCGQFIQQQFVALTKPATKSLVLGSISDLTRTNK